MVRSAQTFLGHLGTPEKKLLECTFDRHHLATRSQLFSRKLADGLQHPETRFVDRGAGFRKFVDKTLIDDARQCLDRVDGWLGGDGADRLSPLQCPTTDEDAQPPKEHSLLWCEQVMTPGDGVAQRPLPRREVARAAGQRQPATESDQECLWREEFHPGGGQLDGERQTVEP